MMTLMRQTDTVNGDGSVSAGRSLRWGITALALVCFCGCTGAPPSGVKPETVNKNVAVGETVTLDLSSIGGSNEALYEWAQTKGPSAHLIDSNSQQLMFTPEEGGEYEFTLTISNGNGGTRVITVHVTVSGDPGQDPLKVEAGPDCSVLPGGSITLAGSASGGTPPYQYAWTPTDGLSDPASPQPTASPSATTVYTLTITDSTGATASDSVQVAVQQPAVLEADAGPDCLIVPGNSVVLAGSTSGGTPPYQYAWAPTEGLSDPASPQPTASPSATTTYTLTVTDSDGASDSDSVTVSIGTPVSGPYWSNTTWTAANSPYLLVGDVQIPEGITLTIDPGVEVRYTGSTQIYVRGAVIANGSPAQKIAFGGANPLVTAGATFLKFEGANLSDSQLSYIVMSNAVEGIRMGKESRYEPSVNPKNTGTLTVSHAELDATQAIANGRETNTRLVLTDCVLSSSTVVSEQSISEPIDILNSTINNCLIKAREYCKGITLNACTVAGTQFSMDGSRIVIQDCTLSQCSIYPEMTASGAFLQVQRCDCTDVGVFAGEVAIADSSFRYDAAYAPVFGGMMLAFSPPAAKVTCGWGTIEYTTLTGNDTGTGLEIQGSYSPPTPITLSHCTIAGNETGILRSWYAGSLSITDSNLQSNSPLNIDNRLNSNVSATNNYWGTDNPAQIGTTIRDYFENITLGKVVFAPYASAPIADAGPRP